MKILHLDSSIQGENSVSRALSIAVIKHLRAGQNTIQYMYRDLVNDPLPHLTLEGFQTPDASETLDQFLSSDVIVMGAPMYNFGVSTQLKSWFDHILVAGKTFRYGDSGVVGLAGDKRVVVALSRGGFYSDGAGVSMEHAETHLRAMLAFIGISKPEFIIAEGSAISPDHRKQAESIALKKIGQLPRVSH